ncbi:MAG: enoyl-CoA hydratase/isomerase family protein [Bryobacteraceae bacterium]|nr:enoyl-CoA hydratase/isomerase family protein [Bryobacteraceae bacterium]
MSEPQDLVVFSRDGEIGIITINNPPVNALSPGVPEGIAAGVATFNADPAIQAIVVIGGGRTFIAGADIKEFGKITSGQKSAAIGLVDVCLQIEDSAKPVIMAIHGTALGGGLETAMAGHYRVAVASAQVGQPEVKLGIIPGAAGTQRLPRLAGLPVALDMCVYGAPISASAALDCGILDDVIMGDLLQGAIDFARDKAGLPFSKVRDRQDKLTDAGAIAAARAKLEKRGRALLAETRAIDAIEAATQLSFADGCAKEAEYFKECLFSNQSKGMIHSFFGERAVAKIPDLAKDTPVLPVKSVAVIGAGTMGGGIAMVYANAGFPVLLKESTPEALERGLATIRKNYANTVQKGRLTEAEMEQRLGRITGTLTYDGFDAVDLITEAVFENMALKQQIFAEIDAVARPGCILASNTSTLDIDAIASATKRPEWVIGTHFFSPANVMRLLEVVRGARTLPTVQATAMALAKQLKKTGVMVGNCFGFVGNRMFGPYRREAELLVQEGATPQQVDAALYNFGMAMGPLATGDLAGLDVGWRVRQENPAHFAGVRQPVIEDRLVEAGRYGQKTGQGWYTYDASRRPQEDAFVTNLIQEVRKQNGIVPRAISAEETVTRTIYALINEGAHILAEGFALRSVDIDMIYVMGYGFPAWRGGPMFYADTVGLAKVVEKMKSFGWTPAPLLVQLATEGRRFTDWSRPL